MYTKKNYKTKKAFKEAVANGEIVEYFQPGGMFPTPMERGVRYFEGPHYPEPHRWYASALCEDGVVIGPVK